MCINLETRVPFTPTVCSASDYVHIHPLKRPSEEPSYLRLGLLREPLTKIQELDRYRRKWAY